MKEENVIYSYESEFGMIYIEGDEKFVPKHTGQTNISGNKGKVENTVIKATNTKFEKALSVIKYSCKSLEKVLDELGPDEVTIEFNLKSKGEAGFFAICKASTEADFKISCKWDLKKKNRE